jgi:pimeloyl-ACP methyl ester carboxylesterase
MMTLLLLLSLPLVFLAAAHGEPVAWVTPTGTLHGTLVVPPPDRGEAPWPVALIHPGSGPTDRDGNSALLPGRNDSLKLLAEALAREGIATLRIDKRGIAASRAAGPEETELRFDHFVADAVGWLARLRADERFGRVGAIGHSEGATIVTEAAAAEPVDFLVLIAGPGRRPADVLRAQMAGRLPPALAEENERILAALERGETVAEPPAALAVFYRTSVQPYLVSWFRRDPVVALASTSAPTLVVHGSTDLQVSLDDAAALAAARPGVELLVVEGMNHILKPVSGTVLEQAASYQNPDLPLAGGLVEAIGRFVRRPPP